MSLLTLALLLIASLSATWGLMALAMVQTHPAPSQTTLIGQFIFCVISAPVAVVAAFVSWFFGG